MEPVPVPTAVPNSSSLRSEEPAEPVESGEVEWYPAGASLGSPSRAGWLCCVQVHPLWLPGGGDPLPDPEGPGEPKCTTGCPQGTGAAQPRTSTEAAGAGPEGIPPLAPPGVTWSIKFLSCCPGSCLAPKPTLWGRAHFDLSQPKFGGSVAQEGSLDDPRAQRGH